MALFDRIALTRKGKNLIARAHAENSGIRFTGAKTGDGVWSDDEDLETATSLKSIKQEFGISSVSLPHEGEAYVDIVVCINNKGLSALYYLREMGLFAEDPQSGDAVLYAILTASQPIYIPEDNGVGMSVITETINLEVANAASVSIDTTGALVSASLFGEVRQIVNLIADGLHGGNPGENLVKTTGDPYGFGWVNQIYVGPKDSFPEEGYQQGIYVDPDSSAIYVWDAETAAYSQLPLGAEASEVLQKQITTNANAIKALNQRFVEKTVAVKAESWSASTESGIVVYRQEISVAGMTAKTNADVLPNQTATEPAEAIREQDALALFFQRGRAESASGKLRLLCYKKKPAANFSIILRGQ